MGKKNWIIWLLIVLVILGAANMAYKGLDIIYEQESSEKESNDINNKGKENNKVKRNNEDKENSKKETVNTSMQNRADDFTVYDENKNKIKLSHYIGKPIVVNVWASWCPPCKREMPLFEKAINQYGERITFLMINETDGQRETMDTAKAFVKDKGYKMKTLFDLDGDVGNTYSILYLPTTLFIDKNGNIVENHVGELTKCELENAIGKILN